MENELICLDSSVLIEYFRKTDKSNSFLFQLSQNHQYFAISAVVYFEVLKGSNFEQDNFWHTFFENIEILPLTKEIIGTSISLHRDLKTKRKTSDAMDLLIASTAMFHGLKLATLNTKHFIHFSDLEIIKK